MEPKGYVLRSGRVVQSRDGWGDAILAELRYDEQHYNLTRYLVSRTWYGMLQPAAGTWRENADAAGRTRREVIEQLLKLRAEAERHGEVNTWCRVEGIPLKAADCPNCQLAARLGVAS